MNRLIAVIVLFLGLSLGVENPVVGQETKRELVTEYWDKDKKIISAQGYYRTEGFSDLGKKEGDWTFYFRNGKVQQNVFYVRGFKHGKATEFFATGKRKHEGYFYWDVPDSTMKTWNEQGILIEEGNYCKGMKCGIWIYKYDDGKNYMQEEYADSILYLNQYYNAEGVQEVKDGEGKRIVKFSNGKVKEELEYSGGVKNGKYAEYSWSGKKIAEGAYAAGKMNGLWKVWLPDGTISLETNYSNDIRHGKHVQYYDNGTIQVAGNYNNGLKDGEWVWFARNGVKDIQGTFKDDLREGLWQQWHINGKLHSEGHFDNNKKTGTWKYYYEFGGLWKQGDFDNDFRTGLWTTWFENGKKLQEGNYQKDMAHGLWQSWYDNGQIKDEGSFKDGLMEGQWRGWYPNGKISYQGNRLRDMQTGKWTFFFSNGKLKEEGEFKIVKRKDALGEVYEYMKNEYEKSVKTGLWVMYGEKDGKKTGEGEFADGKMNGTWKYYYPGGEVAAVEVNYKNGDMHGKTTEFTPRGKKKMEMNYKDNLKHGDVLVFDKKEHVIMHTVYKEGRLIKDEIKKTKYKYSKN
jgi:antitoxin component YwqK of YwqJK toxin-antitoxin module